MVAAGDQFNAGELDHTVVEGGDGFHVQVVRRLIEDQAVRAADHHGGELAADLLAARENLDLLDAVLAAEEHPAEEAADIGDILDLGVAGQPLRDVLLGVEELGVVLLEIGLRGSDAPLVGAAVGLHVAHQNFEEGGLRLLLGADERDLVIVLDDKGDVVEELDAADGLRQMLHGQNLIADLAVGTEVDERVLTGRGLDFVELDLLEGTLSGGRLLGLGSVRGEAGDEFLQLLDLLLLLLVGFLHLADHQLGGLVPEVIVAGVERDFAVVDVCDVGADLVQEVAVMRDDDDDVGEIDEELLQPCNGVKVQMVRRLVEKKDVGAAEQGSCQKDLDLLRTVQIPDLPVVVLVLNAEAVQEGFGVGLCLIPAHLGVFALELRGADAVLVREIGLCIELVLLLADLVKLLVALDDGIQNDLIVVFLVVLLQEGKALAGRDGDLAVRGLQLAGEDFQKGGFPGAVGADDAVAVSFREFDVDIFKKGLLADPVGDVVR